MAQTAQTAQTEQTANLFSTLFQTYPNVSQTVMIYGKSTLSVSETCAEIERKLCQITIDPEISTASEKIAKLTRFILRIKSGTFLPKPESTQVDSTKFAEEIMKMGVRQESDLIDFLINNTEEIGKHSSRVDKLMKDIGEIIKNDDLDDDAKIRKIEQVFL